MIRNRSRFPEVDFLPENEIRIIGTVGSERLALVGFEQGTEVPVVARSQGVNPVDEELFAVPLYELLSHSSEPISILEKIVRK